MFVSQKIPKEATIQIVQDRSSISVSTYVQFRKVIYRQKEGYNIGNPISAILCGFFMQQRALTKAREGFKPSWKRYVDDIFKKVNKGHTQLLTDHLNSIDTMGSLKFTQGKKKEQSIALLDLNTDTLKIKYTGNLHTNIFPGHLNTR